MSAATSLIGEIQNSLQSGSSERRSEVLRRITDLFLSGAETFGAEQVALFDDVIGYLVEKIERQALVELSGRLAPLPTAPVNVVHRLSRDDDIAISGPVLEKSRVLSDQILVEIARTKGQSHLLAIAGRRQISPQVTDVLVDRGNTDVTHKVVANEGAEFSESGFAKVADKARRDPDLAAFLAHRRDVSPEVLDNLVRHATGVVRERLMANAAPAMQQRIAQAVAGASNQVGREDALGGDAAGGRTPKHLAELRTALAAAADAGDQALTTERLAALCDVPVAAVRNLVRQEAEDGMLILGKAADLGWPLMRDVLNATMPAKVKSPDGAKALFENFITLSAANAQRVIRFIKMRKAASRDDLRKLM